MIVAIVLVNLSCSTDDFLAGRVQLDGVSVNRSLFPERMQDDGPVSRTRSDGFTKTDYVLLLGDNDEVAVLYSTHSDPTPDSSSRYHLSSPEHARRIAIAVETASVAQGSVCGLDVYLVAASDEPESVTLVLPNDGVSMGAGVLTIRASILRQGDQALTPWNSLVDVLDQAVEALVFDGKAELCHEAGRRGEIERLLSVIAS